MIVTPLNLVRLWMQELLGAQVRHRKTAERHRQLPFKVTLTVVRLCTTRTYICRRQILMYSPS